MMPCRLCTKYDAGGVPVVMALGGGHGHGLKLVGKTKRRAKHWKNKFGEAIAKDALGERFYRCQDCGAFWRFTFDAVTKQSSEEPVFAVVEGE